MRIIHTSGKPKSTPGPRRRDNARLEAALWVFTLGLLFILAGVAIKHLLGS